MYFSETSQIKYVQAMDNIRDSPIDQVNQFEWLHFHSFVFWWMKELQCSLFPDRGPARVLYPGGRGVPADPGRVSPAAPLIHPLQCFHHRYTQGGLWLSLCRGLAPAACEYSNLTLHVISDPLHYSPTELIHRATPEAWGWLVYLPGCSPLTPDHTKEEEKNLPLLASLQGFCSPRVSSSLVLSVRDRLGWYLQFVNFWNPSWAY